MITVIGFSILVGSLVAALLGIAALCAAGVGYILILAWHRFREPRSNLPPGLPRRPVGK